MLMRWKSLPVDEQQLREDAQGDYHNDMREGKGTQVGADGSQYVGEFRVTTSGVRMKRLTYKQLDRKEGYGVYEAADGSRYEGRLVNTRKGGERAMGSARRV